MQFGRLHVRKGIQGKCDGRICGQGQLGGFEQIVRRGSHIEVVGLTSGELKQLGQRQLGDGHAVLGGDDGALVGGLLSQHVVEVAFRGRTGIDQLLDAVDLASGGFRIELGNRQEFFLEQHIEVGGGQAQGHVVLGNLDVGLGQLQPEARPSQVEVVLKPVEQGQTRAHAVVARLHGVSCKLVGEGVNALTDVHPVAGRGVEVGKEGTLCRGLGKRAPDDAKLGLLKLKVVLQGVLETALKGPHIVAGTLGHSGGTEASRTKKEKAEKERAHAQNYALNRPHRWLPSACERQTMRKRP